MPDPQRHPAAESLLAEHLPALLGYVRLHADPVIRRHESCSDIVQSVCSDVIEHLDGFEYRGAAAFRSWLFAQAMSKLLNRRRYYLAQKRDVRRQQPLAQASSHSGIEGLYASLCSPSQEAAAHEAVERLERAFDRLPDDYKQVVTLSRLCGMSHAEIGEQMGRPEGAVRALLHRALVRLGRLMEEQARKA